MNLQRCIILLFPLILLIRSECRADIKFIHFEKIDPKGQYSAQQTFLLDNLSYYDHWSPQWNYDISQDSIIRELKGCLVKYATLKANVFETDLLLGEIAHYLYNLNQEPYYDTAEAFYLKAVAADDKDCRGYWFLGYHYALSNEIKKGVLWFDRAMQRVNNETGNEFWQEYAFAMMLGGMPSHCQYGLDIFFSHGGKSTLAGMMDSSLKAERIPADPDISYVAKDIWQPNKKGDKVSFASRLFGIKLDADSNWRMQIMGYSKRLAALSMQSALLTSPKGARIGYTIALVVRVPQNGEKLEDFMASMMKMGGTRDPGFAFQDIYPGGLSYTLKSNSIYPDRGGAHIHYIGIERSCPRYPGLALEDEAKELESQPGKVEIQTLNKFRSRFRGRIFYFFVLDTCEDIHEASWNAFSELMKGMRLD